MIIKKLKEKNRYELTTLLIVMTLFCFTLSLFRFYVTNTKVFLFLNWNLFLAFIPWVASSVVIINPRLNKNKIATLIILMIWILFFPNSPYILTDLFHLKPRSSAPIWFDLILILSYAWTGLLYGFISLMDIESLLKRKLSNTITFAGVTMLLFLGSFGIYLGRYLRWNSWDVLQEPYSLLNDIGDRFINPFSHPRTWGLTILMGVLLNLIYLSIKLVRKSNNSV